MRGEKITMKNGTFMEFLYEVTPIRFMEPLAETLGALKRGERVIEYGFPDLVKMAGHACPTMGCASSSGDWTARAACS